MQGVMSSVRAGRRSLADRLRSIRMVGVLAAIAAGAMIACEAQAHPHVWVTMKSEVVYAADGSVTGVRHAWTFDDMFSSFALQGIAHKKKGEYTRAELMPLAEVNVTSLKEYGYFTRVSAEGKKVPISDPVDYWLSYADGVLTLHFTLPLKSPAASKSLRLTIYDPTWFIDFSFAETEPVALRGAPAGCRLDVQRRTGFEVVQSQRPGEAFFNSLGSTSSFGAQFSNKVFVQCP
jgi:ABC-type uncharacterized transport system substrate-binding protein